MRLQLALNVRNLEEAIDFYGRFFNAKPHKVRKGYANFAIDAPPLKLVLLENPRAAERLNHLGVEVFEQKEVDRAQQRFGENRILDSVETQALCCHAVQNKVWAREPQGLKWEWYRITDDNPPDTERRAGCGAPGTEQGETTCCAPGAEHRVRARSAA
ncbi:MAG TPA: ArsI/CadI family heavy metal resistance metalloenzyme [Gammaproteobacteria bacterium]|nr:ArsI/CadI family heavy metal resistance metalloenzyme [Gammaproteobacteria bacterium]